MALKEIAVDGLTIDHDSGSIVSGGSFTITSIPSLKVKCENKGVYTGTLSFSFSGGYVSPDDSGTTGTGTGTIMFTAQKVKAENQFVLRKGDTGTMSGTYVKINPAAPPPTVPGTFTNQPVKITDAGQTKVLAN